MKISQSGSLPIRNCSLKIELFSREIQDHKISGIIMHTLMTLCFVHECCALNTASYMIRVVVGLRSCIGLVHSPRSYGILSLLLLAPCSMWDSQIAMDPRSSFAPQCNQMPCKWMIFLPLFQTFRIQRFWKLHVWYTTAVWDDLRELLVSWQLPLFNIQTKATVPWQRKWEIGMHSHLSPLSQWTEFSAVAHGSQCNVLGAVAVVTVILPRSLPHQHVSSSQDVTSTFEAP